MKWAIAAIACVLLAILGLSEFMRGVLRVPEPTRDYLDFQDRVTAVLASKLKPAPAHTGDPHAGEQRTMVEVSFLPSDVGPSDVTVDGLAVQTRLRSDMRGECETPWDCESLVFYGRAPIGTKLIAKYRHAPFKLRRFGGAKLVLWANYSDVPFFDPSTIAGNGYSEKDIDANGGRVFLPSPGEPVKNVWTSGRPVIEIDRFTDGVWSGSYVIWRTPEETEKGALTKYP